MKDFLAALEKIKRADSAKDFVKAEKDAYAKLDQLMDGDAIVPVTETKDPLENFIKSFRQANQAFGPDPSAPGFIAGAPLTDDNLLEMDWLAQIPSITSALAEAKREERKKAKKKLMLLIKIASLKSITRWETVEQLKKQVHKTKAIDALNELIEGQKILISPKDNPTLRYFQAPTLQERYLQAWKRSLRPGDAATQFTAFESATIKPRHVYLRKKNDADSVAMGLNFFVSLFGVGLISAVAMMEALPALGRRIMLSIFSGATVTGGYAEGFVYYGYIQKFCRAMADGFFKRGIDRSVYKKYAKDWYGCELYELTKDQFEKIKKASRVARYTRYILSIIAAPFALAAGVGFMGLAFSQVLELLTVYLLVTSPIILTIVPWAVAVMVIPYAALMYGMLYKAIKDNIFKKIWEGAKEFFGKGDKRLLLIKIPLVILVVAISVVATLFTAGAWLQSSISFFHVAFRAIGLVANYVEPVITGIGRAIGVIFLLSNLMFSSDKSIKTANGLFNTNWKKAGLSFVDAFTSPKKIFKGFLKYFPLAFHIAGNAAVAAKGSEGLELQEYLESYVPIDELTSKIYAAVSEAIEETAVDLNDVVLEDLQHDHQSMYKKHGFGHLYKVHDHYELVLITVDSTRMSGAALDNFLKEIKLEVKKNEGYPVLLRNEKGEVHIFGRSEGKWKLTKLYDPVFASQPFPASGAGVKVVKLNDAMREEIKKKNGHVAKQHHCDHNHDHSHGDLWKTGKMVVNWVGSFFKPKPKEYAVRIESYQALRP